MDFPAWREYGIFPTSPFLPALTSRRLFLAIGVRQSHQHGPDEEAEATGHGGARDVARAMKLRGEDLRAM